MHTNVSHGRQDLSLRRLFVLLGLVLVVSFAFGQTAASDFPPDELLQRITADGLRAHMAFLADDLLEGRGTGTRGYQLAANYVRAQFQEMGLKPAGVNGTFFQNVRFRKIELLKDKSSLTLKHNGTTRTLVLDKDYVMGGDPLSGDTKVEGEVGVRRFRRERAGVRLRRLCGDRRPGQDCGRVVWRSGETPVRSRRPFFLLRTEAAHGRGAWGDRIPYYLGRQGGTAHSVFRIRAFFEGAGAALAG